MKLLRYVVAVWMMWTAVAGGLVAYGLADMPDTRCDVIIVAGAGLRADDTPGPKLDARTRRAASLVAHAPRARLVLTGGGGPVSEAAAASRLAQTLGVGEHQMILEDTSVSTWTNAENARALVQAERVLVVTDHFHVWRARRVFGRHFEQADALGVWSASPGWVYGAYREVPAVIWYAATGRL